MAAEDMSGGGGAPRVVFAWGVGEDGQLGVPADGAEGGGAGSLNGGSPPPGGAAPPGPPKEWYAARPTVVGSLPDTVEKLVAGSRYSGALARDGGLYTWGWNQKRTLGLGADFRTQACGAPARVHALTERRVSEMAFGGWHAVALDADGQVYVWGGNEYRQGNDTGSNTLPSPVPGPTSAALRVKQVAAGGMHSLVVAEGGDVWEWGQPLVNFLGAHSRPSRVSGLSNVRLVAAGEFHNLALTKDGHVYAWGNADFGQLGLGTTTHVSQPQLVETLSGVGVRALSAGGWHSLAASEDGDVWVWGRGEYGRLGLGEDYKDRLVPALLEATKGTKITAVQAGGTHSLLLTEDGVALSFGRTSYGRLGRTFPDGDACDPAPRPVELPVPETGGRWLVLSIAAGGRHSLLLAEREVR